MVGAAGQREFVGVVGARDAAARCRAARSWARAAPARTPGTTTKWRCGAATRRMQDTRQHRCARRRRGDRRHFVRGSRRPHHEGIVDVGHDARLWTEPVSVSRRRCASTWSRSGGRVGPSSSSGARQPCPVPHRAPPAGTTANLEHHRRGRPAGRLGVEQRASTIRSAGWRRRDWSSRRRRAWGQRTRWRSSCRWCPRRGTRNDPRAVRRADRAPPAGRRSPGARSPSRRALRRKLRDACREPCESDRNRRRPMGGIARQQRASRT